MLFQDDLEKLTEKVTGPVNDNADCYDYNTKSCEDTNGSMDKLTDNVNKVSSFFAFSLIFSLEAL